MRDVCKCAGYKNDGNSNENFPSATLIEIYIIWWENVELFEFNFGRAINLIPLVLRIHVSISLGVEF